MRQAQQRVSSSRAVCNWGRANIIPPEPEQDWDQLWRLTHLLAQRTSLGVGVLHFGRCLPFRHQQCRAEGDVQGQGLLGMLRRLGKVLSSSMPVVTWLMASR